MASSTTARAVSVTVSTTCPASVPTPPRNSSAMEPPPPRHHRGMPRVLLLVPSATYRAGDFLGAARALGAELVVGGGGLSAPAAPPGRRRAGGGGPWPPPPPARGPARGPRPPPGAGGPRGWPRPASVCVPTRPT